MCSAKSSTVPGRCWFIGLGAAGIPRIAESGSILPSLVATPRHLPRAVRARPPSAKTYRFLYNQPVVTPLAKVTWHGDTLQRIRSFPAEARQDCGYQLERVQRGRDPRDWKPMPTVGQGVIEIRVHAGSEYRVLYMTRLADGVHVLHAFVKKTRKARQADIQLARKRYREITKGERM